MFFLLGMSVNDNFLFSSHMWVVRCSLFVCLLHILIPYNFTYHITVQFHFISFGNGNINIKCVVCIRIHAHLEWNKWSTSLNYEINWPISNLKFITRNIYADEFFSSSSSNLLFFFFSFFTFDCLVCSKIQWAAFYWAYFQSSVWIELRHFLFFFVQENNNTAMAYKWVRTRLLVCVYCTQMCECRSMHSTKWIDDRKWRYT